MRFSIIIPVKELNPYLDESMPRILALEHSDFEVLVVPDHMPHKKPGYAMDRRVRIITSGAVSPAKKRDLAAGLATGNILAFIDDDAYPAKNWLSVAERAFFHIRAEALAGPALTPPGSVLLERASGVFFESFLGSGGLSYRYKPAKRSFYVDDYPTVNLLVRKSVFDDIGGFDSAYWPGEDTKFCEDMTDRGYRIYYVKNLIVFHHRRRLFRPHLRQVGRYGRHRGYFARTRGRSSLKPAYFAPTVFLFGLAVMLSLGLFLPGSAFALGVMLFVYFFAVSIDVFLRTDRAVTGVLAVAAVFLSHIVYGWSFLKGVLAREFRSVLR